MDKFVEDCDVGRYGLLDPSFASATSGTAPQSGDLPLTPADIEEIECHELDLDNDRQWSLADNLSDQIPSASVQRQEGLFTSVCQFQEDDVLVMPWIAGGAVARLTTLNTLSAPQRATLATDPVSQLRSLTNRRKRPASIDVSMLLGPPTKAVKQLVSDIEEDVQEHESIVYGAPHMLSSNAGVEGCYCCSCGKAFSAKSSLGRHLHEQSGAQPFACSVCGKQFNRKDVCTRHERNQCKNGKDNCPCCGKLFRKDYLRQHLQSDANMQCQLFVQAQQLNAQGAQAGSKVVDAERHYWGKRASAWGLSMPTHASYPSAVALFNLRPTKQEKTGWEPSLRKRAIPRRPIQRSSEEPCDICGMRLGHSEVDIEAHLRRHLQDFARKSYKCGHCQLFFAHDKDLQRHLEAAQRGYCGLNFSHHGIGQSTSPSASTLCTGHHPPGDPHHRRMRLCLWNWEQCQLLAHRATVVRILADRVTYTQPSHASLYEQDLFCMAFARCSMGSLHSFNSAPAKPQFKDFVDMETLTTTLQGLMLDPGPDLSLAIPLQGRGVERARPDSVAISDLVSGFQDSNPSALTMGKYVGVGLQANYVDQMRTLRNPRAAARGMKSASGIRRYTAWANRSLLGSGHAFESR